MKLISKVTYFFGGLGLVNSLKLILAVTLIGGTVIGITAGAGFLTYLGVTALYSVSPLSVAALPVILLFGIPTVAWLLYGTAQGIMDGIGYAQRRLG